MLASLMVDRELTWSHRDLSKKYQGPKLTGKIPASIGKLTSLTELYTSALSLSGHFYMSAAFFIPLFLLHQHPVRVLKSLMVDLKLT